MKRTVFGFGINDAGYPVRPRKSKNEVRSAEDWCPYYRKWAHMIQRCYDEKFHPGRSDYKDVYVCDEWALFSNFRLWAVDKYQKGLFLDKDILGNGKIYSPDSCAFVDIATNNFILDKGAKKRGGKIGYYYNKSTGKYQVSCSDPFLKKNIYIGRFETPEEAYKAWREAKHLHALKLAEKQIDQRVAQKLRELFSPNSNGYRHAA